MTYLFVYTPFELYLSAAFWSFTTIATVGYGDIYPVTDAEKLFSTVAMIVACGVFAFVVGMIGSLFDRNDSIITDFKDKLFYIN